MRGRLAQRAAPRQAGAFRLLRLALYLRGAEFSRNRQGRPMQIISTEIAEVKEIRPVRHRDPRGFFSEIFREDVLRRHGIDVAFVQENHSLSTDRGVVRGLHFQVPPEGQAKLVRVATGSVLDVAVDIRWGSPSYGRPVAK